MKKLFLLIAFVVLALNYNSYASHVENPGKTLGPVVVEAETPAFVSPFLSDLMLDCISSSDDYVPGIETATPKCYCQQKIGGEKCNKLIECPGSYCWSCLGMIPEAR